MKICRSLLLVLFLLVFLTFVVGCEEAVEEPVDEPVDEEEPVEEEDPIHIGCTLPLSGPYAETGTYVRDGYEFWVDQINEEGGLLGREVELTVIDDESDPTEAVAQIERLIEMEGVDLLIGGYPGDTCSAQMAAVEEHQMVYVSMGGHMTSFEQGFEYSFGAPPLMGEWWYIGFFEWLEQLPEEERPTRAGMMTVNNPVGLAVRDCAITGLEDLGIEIVMDELYDLPLDSAEPFVSRAMAEEADIFFANGFFADGVVSVEAVSDLGYEPKAILQGIGTLVPAWEDELGEDGNYVISGTAMHPDLPFENVDLLNEHAQEEYGRSAPPYFMFGVAWMQTLHQGVEGAGSLDQDEIRDWLKEESVNTVGGELTFDERGLPESYGYTTQVQDGSPELVWPEEVKAADIKYPYYEYVE